MNGVKMYGEALAQARASANVEDQFAYLKVLNMAEDGKVIPAGFENLLDNLQVDGLSLERIRDAVATGTSMADAFTEELRKMDLARELTPTVAMPKIIQY